MGFLFGAIGFMVGAILVYWLQKRSLGNVRERLKRAEKALEQTEALNRQQTIQLQKFREAQTQAQNLEPYYQEKLQQLQQSYEVRIQELEQSQMPNLQQDAGRKAEIERLQAQQEAQLQQKIQELEASYQSRIAELEQLQQLQEPPQFSEPPPEPIVAPASSAPSEEEAWKKTQAYWSEPEETGPESFLINPFLGETLQKKQESSDIDSPELDLASLLNSESDEALRELERWQNQNQSEQLKEPHQTQTVSSDLELLDTLEVEKPGAIKLPEMPNNNEDSNILTDLFSDSESGEDDLQDFLAMLQSEGESDHQNGQANSK